MQSAAQELAGPAPLRGHRQGLPAQAWPDSSVERVSRRRYRHVERRHRRRCPRGPAIDRRAWVAMLTFIEPRRGPSLASRRDLPRG